MIVDNNESFYKFERICASIVKEIFWRLWTDSSVTGTAVTRIKNNEHPRVVDVFSAIKFSGEGRIAVGP